MLRALPPPDPSGQGYILSEPCIPAPYGRRSGIEIKRTDCGGRLFTAKLAVLVHYLPHQLLD